MKRFSRSDSVEDRAGEFGAARLGQVGGEVAQRPGRSDDGGERRAQVVRDRGEQRLAQAVGLGGAERGLDVGDEVDALDGDGRLVGQGVEQAALLRGEQRAGALGVEADDADGAAGGAQRHEQAAGARQRVGAAAGGAVVLVAPAGGGDVGGLERVLGRIAGADRDRAVGVGQQQDHLHAELRGHLVGGGPEHVVELGGAGELAAEGVELLGGAGAALGRHCLETDLCGEIGDEHGDDREEEEGREVRRAGDRQRVDRLQEEEVVAQRPGNHREERRPEAEADRDRHHGGQEGKVERLDADERLDQLGDGERGKDSEQRYGVRDPVEPARQRRASGPSFSGSARRLRLPR